MKIPSTARPHEVAILRVYLQDTYEPVQIATILHYQSPQPVYRVIRKFRDFLAQERAQRYTGTITIAV